MQLRLPLLIVMAGAAACQHAGSLAAPTRPTVGLMQRLVEREHAISLHNGFAIDQANIFTGENQMRYKVSQVRCTDLANGRFDCRFSLERSLGSDRSTDMERRRTWRQPQGGWTTDLIEELCAQQRQALGTTDCVGIVDN
jgi:hypothetical protein